MLAIFQLRIFYHLTCHVSPKIKSYTVLYKVEKLLSCAREECKLRVYASVWSVEHGSCKEN
jgi:hypothetical protein